MHKSFNLQENVSLAPLTTLEVGGAARFFVRAETEEQIADAFFFAAENNFDLFVIGGGSNVVIGDNGFDGVVVQPALGGVTFAAPVGGTVQVTACAGENWDELVAACVGRNLAGIECLSGIPGLTGATPVQNVGGYGQEVAETIVRVRVFDRKSANFLELTNADCRFSYRSSIFNTTDKNRFIVVSVTFALTENGAPHIAYKDLREKFGERQPTLAETRRAVLEIRRAKSMVIAERDENRRSAGSFFKNPIISRKFFDRLAAEFDGAQIPNFQVGADAVKVPAAWLIENSGFHKGFRRGSVGISTKHALALINLGGATANDLIALKSEIQSGVEKKFGIRLETEPVFVGITS